jgi:hypothetical protein
MTIWRMRTAHWITKAPAHAYTHTHTHTHTHTEYVTIIAFPLQRWLHEPRLTSFIESIIHIRLLFKTTKPFNIIRAIHQQKRQCTYKHNIEVHSCNHGCNEKAISITYSECVFVALCVQHAKHMRRITICYLSDCTIFLYIFS